MKPVVVDASLAVPWAIPERFTRQSLRLVDSWAREKVRMIAPCLFLAEVTNALYKRTIRKELSESLARQALELILSFNVEIVEEAGLQDRTLNISHELGLPATYDAYYLSLAEAYGCELWTGDRKFALSAVRKFTGIRWIGDITG